MYIQFDISDFSVTISSFFLIPFYYLVIWFLASSSPLLSKSNKKTHRFIDVFLKRIFKSYECSAFKLIKRCKKGVFSHKVHLIIPWILTLPYHFGILPWQMNSIFIIVLFLLNLPQNSLFCKVFWGYYDMLWNYRLWQIRARLSKLLLPVAFFEFPKHCFRNPCLN